MSKKSAGSIVLYVAASVVIVIALALLINNIVLFRNVLAQYVSQGYSAAEVMKQLVPSQLLPGVFEPVAVYGGLAALLFAAGAINQKASKCLALLAGEESGDETEEEADLENGSIEAEDGEDIGQAEFIGEDDEESGETTDDGK